MVTSPFSIIVPVYNDENNLPRCIDSILSQTFVRFECLIINDGSTDNCPYICNEYARKDKRIRVFHKKNEGISKTRQFGINHAKGEYTFFVDSDDWVEPSFLADIDRKLDKDRDDILFMDFFEENALGKELCTVQNPASTDTETIIRLVLEGKLYSCLWNVVINRNLYAMNNITFSEDINYGEDSLFIIELLLNKPSIGYLAGAYYHHTFNHGSFTRTNRKQRYLNRVKFLEQLPLLLEKYDRNDLAAYNFFPLNDKYEILCSGVFNKNEYQALFSSPIDSYYLKQSGFRKYVLLIIAETFFYPMLKFSIISFRSLKKKMTGNK